MTLEQLIFKVETKSEFEFSYHGKNYNLTYGIDNAGKDYIAFGQTYEGVKYYSLKELLNKAKIENHYFKEMLDIL